jgi:hypothetical protein
VIRRITATAIPMPVKATAPRFSSRITAVLKYPRLLTQPNALPSALSRSGSARDESNGARGRYAGWAVDDNGVGAILNGKRTGGIADGDSVHLAAMRALNF